MKPPRLWMLLALAFATILGAGFAQESTPARQHGVVFELTSSDPDTWNGLLNNVENIRRALGEDRTEVEVVAHGKALAFMMRTNERFAARMQQLGDAGVVFAACENTMRRQHVTKAQLLPFVRTVDSGVAEVVRKQEAGWSYIRVAG